MMNDSNPLQVVYSSKALSMVLLFQQQKYKNMKNNDTIKNSNNNHNPCKLYTHRKVFRWWYFSYKKQEQE